MYTNLFIGTATFTLMEPCQTVVIMWETFEGVVTPRTKLSFPLTGVAGGRPRASVHSTETD